MSFGYLGDTSTKIKQHRKNEGILTPQDVIDLESKNHLGQSLELIESKNLTGTTPSAINFTSIKESEYKIHYLQYNNLQISGSDTIRMRVSTNGGTSYDSSSNYSGAVQTMTEALSFSHSVRVDYDAFDRFGQNASGQPYSGHIYIYNAGDSSRFTTVTFHASNQENGFRFGGMAYELANTVNALQLFLTSHSFSDTSPSVKLYGLKQ